MLYLEPRYNRYQETLAPIRPSFSLFFQGASVLLLGGQRLRRLSAAGGPRHPHGVGEPCDGRSGPSEGTAQGRHVDVQGVRQEQIHVRQTQTGAPTENRQNKITALTAPRDT